MGFLFGSSLKTTMVAREDALPGRSSYAYPIPSTHTVLGTPLMGPWPAGTSVLYLASGCFWGAEKAAFPNYASGEDGPKAADELIGRQGGRHWRVVGGDRKTDKTS